MNFEKASIDNRINQESSVVKNILSGNFYVEFSSKGLDSEKFKSSDHLANYFTYELIIPSPTDKNKDWQTYLTFYHPLNNNDIFNKAPDLEIDILTGQGKMQLSPDPVIKQMIFEKVAEKISSQNPVENEYLPSRHFSFDGFLEMIEFLENNPNSSIIPKTLWVSRKKEINIDNKYWTLMKETLLNFKKTIYNNGGEQEYKDLYDRVKKINPKID